MSVSEAILQATRAWLKAATGLPDEKVIPSDDKGPRPALPYLTVKVIVSDVPVGHDEQRRGLDGSGNPVVHILGQRRATLSIQGFGAATSESLAMANLKLLDPSTRDTLRIAGVSLRALGGLTDISRVVDTAFEARFLREYDVAYRISSAPVEQVPLSEVSAELVIHDTADPEDDDDPLSVTLPLL